MTGASGSGAEATADDGWVVIGSGFGGSVAALRLAEKGHRVTVLEAGRRTSDAQMPKSSWDLRRYFFAPRLGLKGIFRMTRFRDVFIMSGAGVGGGSQVYAMTLYVPPAAFFEDAQWAGMGDWAARLAPHYETAQRMLGVTDVTADDRADRWLREFAEEGGYADTYGKARVGAYLDTPGETVPDPYFGGEGPQRTGCVACGRCMLGCPYGAKNATTKNYLHLAERRGATIEPERTVVDVRPLDGAGGATGWEVVHERTGGVLRRDRRVTRARGVVVAGGALGTNELLARARQQGSLPRLSSRLGELVRTNSEAILGVTVPKGQARDLVRRVAITSSVYPDPHTHIETVVYGEGGGAMKGLMTLMVGDGTRVTRPLKLAAQILRHPGRLVRLLGARGWSERTVIVLVMQSLDNAIRLRARPRRLGRGVRLQTEQDPANPNPTFIPVANAFAGWLARKTGGVAQSSLFEALMNVPSTAHILGGAVVGRDAEHGVVDADLRVHGYENLLVCDGAAIPANVGVNPSLTITALSEHAMSRVAPAPGVADAPGLGTRPIAAKRAGGEPVDLLASLHRDAPAVGRPQGAPNGPTVGTPGADREPTPAAPER